jgi:hypothetical protein
MIEVPERGNNVQDASISVAAEAEAHMVICTLSLASWGTRYLIVEHAVSKIS